MSLIINHTIAYILDDTQFAISDAGAGHLTADLNGHTARLPCTMREFRAFTGGTPLVPGLEEECMVILRALKARADAHQLLFAGLYNQLANALDYAADNGMSDDTVHELLAEAMINRDMQGLEDMA